MTTRCLACDLTSGVEDLPGGRIHVGRHWIVEHCVGPLGIGTLLVKTRRHCLHVADLNTEEAADLGLLLKQASGCTQQLSDADQVYVCLWSHSGWVPGHIHFVVQPAWNGSRDRYSGPGPTTQVEMFRAAQDLRRTEVEAFCDRARAWPGWAGAPS